MFLTLEKTKCPVCGTEAEEHEEISGVKDCPKCGTVFNEFGIVLAPKKKTNLEWN